jgi:hypothetical protein
MVDAHVSLGRKEPVKPPPRPGEADLAEAERLHVPGVMLGKADWVRLHGQRQLGPLSMKTGWASADCLQVAPLTARTI